MEERPSLLRRTALLTGVGFVSQGLSFFYRAALSRMVGAETLGLYHLIMPVYAIIQSVIMSGLAVALSSRSAGYASTGNRKAASQLLETALHGLVLLWLPAAAAVSVCSGPLSAHVLGDVRTRPGLVLLLPVLLLTGVENLHKHHFYGLGETRLPARVELAEQFIRTAAILGLLAVLLPLPQSHAVAVIVVGMLVSEVFSSLTLVILRRKREGPLSAQPGSGEPPATLRKTLLSVALPVSGAALLNNLIASADSILIPQKLVAYGMTQQEAMEEFGVVFGMTLPLLMLPFAFVNALSLALLPQLTSCCALGNSAGRNRCAEQSLRWVSLLLLPMLALLVPLGGDVGAFLFHDSRVGRFLLPLSVTAALTAYESILATILNGIGKQSASAAVSLLSGVIQLGFTCFGVERWGFAACIVGMLLSDLIGAVLRLLIVHRAIHLHLNVFSCFSAPFLSALLAGCWVNLLYQVMENAAEPHLLILFACSLVGCFLYGGSLMVITNVK